MSSVCTALGLDIYALRDVFSYRSLVHAIAGAAGSITALTVFFPLDTARTRLVVDDLREAKPTPVILHEIFKEEGIDGLYRGLFPVITSLCCSNFVYFYTYNGLKNVCVPHRDKEDALQDLLMGFVAGIVNVLLTTPLWVINSRLKIQGANLRTKQYKEQKFPKYRGILDAFLKIVRYEGVSSLWSGMLPSLVLTVNPAVQFMVYEVIKRYFQRLWKVQELSGLTYFFIGAIAKAVATTVSYPVQVIQARSRVGFSKNAKNPKGVIETWQEVIRNNGVKGLFKGLEAKLLQTVLTAALMFMLYEKIAAFIFHIFFLEVSGKSV